jgi:hypothetical protein
MLSSTDIPGQTQSSNSLLLTTSPARSANASRRSKAQSPIFTGTPSRSNRRSYRARRNGPKENAPVSESEIVSNITWPPHDFQAEPFSTFFGQFHCKSFSNSTVF